jgi:chemotaxis response regulator CheB
MEYMQHQRTQNFIGDVRTWKASDPLINAAIDKAAKTTGNAALENVVAAYLEGSKDNVERAMRLKDFAAVMRVTAQKNQRSAFGMPDYRAAEVFLKSETW